MGWEWLGIAAGVFGLVALLAGSLLIVKSTATKTTIESQKELIDTLLAGKEEQKDQIKDLQDKHLKSSTAIAEMQGQINTLRTVPLQEIARDMKAIADTQLAILKLIPGANGKKRIVVK